MYSEYQGVSKTSKSYESQNYVKRDWPFNLQTYKKHPDLFWCW